MRHYERGALKCRLAFSLGHIPALSPEDHLKEQKQEAQYNRDLRKRGLHTTEGPPCKPGSAVEDPYLEV